MFVEQEEELESKEAKEAIQDGMEKIRINDLARELEVKSKAILDYLPTIGIDDKKSHSSSLEGDQVERVRKHFQGELEKAASNDKSRPKGAAPDEIKTKIDLSKISKPGDVLKAIKKTTAEIPAPVMKPATPPAPAKPAAPAAAKTAPPVAAAPVEPPAAPPQAAAPVIERPPVVEKPSTQAVPPVMPPSGTPHPAPISPLQAAPVAS